MKIATALFYFAVAMPFSVCGQKDLSGTWRGEFIIRDSIIAPFNFEIGKDGVVFLLNAGERFESGRVSRRADSVFIPLDQFDNELAFAAKSNVLTGVLRRQDHTGSSIPVSAEKSSLRFKASKAGPLKDFSGRYEVEFTFESGKKENSVAVLQQKGSKLTGTFLKPSGDARYLEGMVEGNRFYLTSFIGSSPGYYAGSIGSDGTILGAQVGTRVSNPFRGKFNPAAALGDPFGIVRLKAGSSTVSFSLPDINGRQISLTDEKFRNKVVIVTITGTWCPNCIDEAGFLAPWYNKNRDRGVEIVTVHYERQSDTAFVNKAMRRFGKRFDIRYQQVFGGLADPAAVLATLNGLQSFSSFPTTIFIGKDGNVSKIHSGFSGPATGKFYEEFVSDFNAEVDRLLAL